ncbi:MAG: UPF0149 family protein [Caldimonas sp.]
MALPESVHKPPSRPPLAAAVQDLSDAEFAELDELLAAIPEPLEPLDAVMLDGFLAAVIVQPELIDVERWLPHVFDASGLRWGEAEPGPEQRRARELIARRFAAMNRSLAEFGGFDPLILEPDEADDVGGPAGAAAAADAAPENAPAADVSPPDAATPDAPPPDAATPDAPTAGAPAPDAPVLDAITRAILPWVAGFEFAASILPGLYELDDDAVATALTRLYRFLPAEGADEEATAALLARERPIASLDAAIEELIACVADLYDLTEARRYQVATVRRATPKVGRNDPCPCGSGRKFKLCHGVDSR